MFSIVRRAIPMPLDRPDGFDIHGESKRPEDAPVVSEVVRRVHKVSKKDREKERDELVSTGWDDVFPLKPRERLRWLHMALVALKANVLT